MMAPTQIAPLGPPLLTAEEVAAHLNCSVEMVYKLRRQGRLRAVRLGATYRWRLEVIRTFLGDMEA
jgi:excisionase family DNA binding protein